MKSCLDVLLPLFLIMGMVPTGVLGQAVSESEQPIAETGQSVTARATASASSTASANSVSQGNGVTNRSTTRTSVNRSVSSINNGKKIRVKEDDSGVTVSVDGRVAKAASVAELKKVNPEAYRIYEEYLGGSNAKARGSASARGLTSGSTRSRQGSNNRSTSSASRSVSVSENGKNISVAEDKNGIRVAMDGRVVRATDADKLKQADPEAYRLYDKYLGSPNASSNSGQSASDLLRSELQKMRDANAGNPQLQKLIEQALQDFSRSGK